MQIDLSIYTKIEFHRGINFSFGNKNDHPGIQINRNAFLVNLVKGKKVIHLGCCDHIDLIEKKRRSGDWLHDILCQKAEFCAGIDIDLQAVNYLKSNLSIPNIFCCDATERIPDELKNIVWDYVIAGDILEHIDNPVKFLNSIRSTFGNNVEQLIISVPNAFSWINFRNATRNIEANNPDHRYWFTPHTLGKVCHQAGLIPKEFFFLNNFPNLFYFSHLYFLMKKYPSLRKNLVMICNFK